MKNLMIIGAGDFQLPLIQEAAKNCKVFLVAPSIDERLLPFIEQICLTDVRDLDKVLNFAKDVKIDGVITDQTDIAVQTVAYVAEQLGLPGIGFETGQLFTNKALMRKKLSELGIPQLPNRAVFSLAAAKKYYTEIGGEVIIKPLDCQGSRGVQVCRSLKELEQKYKESERCSSNRGVIIERRAKGREFFVEGISFANEYKSLICGDTLYFDIPDAFAAKSRIVPSEADSELFNRVCDLDKKIITGFGLKQGISHSEYVMDGDNIYLIETAARGGGVFISSDLIYLSTGLHTEQFLINIALGEQDKIPQIQPQKCYCGYIACYLPIGCVEEISGIEEIKALPYVHRNQLDKLKVGTKCEDGPKDKTSRIAMIVSGSTRAELMDHIAYIRTTLKVRSSTGLGLIWA